MYIVPCVVVAYILFLQSLYGQINCVIYSLFSFSVQRYINYCNYTLFLLSLYTETICCIYSLLAARVQKDLCGQRGLIPGTEEQTFRVALPAKLKAKYERIIMPTRLMPVSLALQIYTPASAVVEILIR